MSKKKWTVGDRVAVIVTSLPPIRSPGESKTEYFPLYSNGKTFWTRGADAAKITLNGIYVLECLQQEDQKDFELCQPDWKVVTE